MKCKEMNPIVIIKVGEGTYTLNDPLTGCNLYRKNNTTVLSAANLVENIVF
jgi:hypothetical protein